MNTPEGRFIKLAPTNTNRYIITAAAITFVIFLTLPMLASAKEPQSGNTDEGRALFLEYCSICHGDKGQGIPPLPPGAAGLIPPAPPLAGGAVTSKSRAQIADYIRNGGTGRGGVMEGFHDALTGSQIDSIIDWIVTLWPERVGAEWRTKDRMAPK